MRFTLPAIATAALIVSGGLARAADQDFTLLNKTGYQIDSVFVSETSNRHWGEDVMGRDTLDNGDSVHIRFNKSADACNWDLRVKYNDGDQATWNNLNLCNISKVTLFWDRRNQTTRATTE